MIKKENIVFIIPTYNEKDSIPDVINAIKNVSKKLRKYNVTTLVVDDNSPDGTQELVKKMQKVNKSIFLSAGEKNGLGSAMIRGIKYSIGTLKADIVVMNEADMSYKPTDSLKMIKLIESGSDFVAASRVLKKENLWPIERKIMHWVSNYLFANLIAGVNEVDDHNCAFRAIRVKGVLEKINFKDFPKGFSFFNYLVFELSLVTQKISNIPVIYYPRTKGESKISLSPKHLRSFISNFSEYIKVCFQIRVKKIFG